jgi:hypothetical protein
MDRIIQVCKLQIFHAFLWPYFNNRFIQDHFADAFRLLSDSPQPMANREEKWISSSTLLEAAEGDETLPLPPRTPEPKTIVPSFSLLTPSGQSPQSLNSTPSTGSPLRSLQFIRRADPESLNHPATPSKVSQHNSQKISPRTPARNSVWRP